MVIGIGNCDLQTCEQAVVLNPFDGARTIPCDLTVSQWHRSPPCQHVKGDTCCLPHYSLPTNANSVLVKQTLGIVGYYITGDKRSSPRPTTSYRAVNAEAPSPTDTPRRNATREGFDSEPLVSLDGKRIAVLIMRVYSSFGSRVHYPPAVASSATPQSVIGQPSGSCYLQPH